MPDTDNEFETENVSMKVEHEPEPEPEIKTKNVNINLLTNVKALLEITISRGSFKANELSSVGKVYDELVSLLQ